MTTANEVAQTCAICRSSVPRSCGRCARAEQALCYPRRVRSRTPGRSLMPASELFSAEQN